MRMFLFLLLVQFVSTASASRTDSILTILDSELGKKMEYRMEKEKQISTLKQSLFVASSVYEQYFICDKLYNEYSSYQFDSAYVYAQKSIEKAELLKNDELMESDKSNLLFCFISAGLFKDAIDVMQEINTSRMSIRQKQIFYDQMSRLYSELARENMKEPYHRKYVNLCQAYCDSALLILPEGSYEYNNVLALKTYTNPDIPSEKKIAFYERITDPKDRNLHQLAINSSILGALYMGDRNSEPALYNLALSAISDIRLGITETASKTTLAIWCYELGNIEKASKYIHASLEDANFYNARHRKVDINAVLPIIDKENMEIVARQNNKLIILLVLVCIFATLLSVCLWFYYKINKKLGKKEKIIREQFNQLQTVSDQLNTAYENLKEADAIKDQYILESLYSKSDYYNKIESILKKIDHKLSVRQYDSIKGLHTEFDLKRERENMFQSFDKTFLMLFPDFVREYNKLFPEDKQVELDEENALTLELRIFALIRLGITNSEKVSQFLNLSINTIYAYKTRIKAKSLVPKEEFEYYIMRIKRAYN